MKCTFSPVKPNYTHASEFYARMIVCVYVCMVINKDVLHVLANITFVYLR